MNTLAMKNQNAQIMIIIATNGKVNSGRILIDICYFMIIT